MELLQTWASEFTRELPDKGSCEPPENVSQPKNFLAKCRVIP